MAAAGVISRILGAVYRIPLANTIGDEGMGLLELAQPLYNFFLVASVAGLPLAVSKLVAERMAIGDERGSIRILRVAIMIMLCTGLASASFMYLGADWLAEHIYHDVRVALAIRAIAPALFFVTVMSAFRGYFQGHQDMGPSAASQVVEQFVRVGTMLVLATTLMPRGVEYAAAGAALGAVTGGLAGLAYLLFVYAQRMSRGKMRSGRVGIRMDAEGKTARRAGRSEETTWELVAAIFAIALPVAIGASVLPIVRAIDSAMVPARLGVAGFSAENATALFGQLSGMALPLAYFPNVLTIALAASIVPAISEALAVGSRAGAERRARAAMRLTALIALPAGLGLWTLSSEICSLVYGRPDVGRVLGALAPASAFLCVLQTSGAILQGMGYPGGPVKNLLIGSAFKVACEWWLTGLPQLNVAGAAISTSVGFAVVALANLADVARRLGRGAGAGLAAEFAKPAISAAVMAAVARITQSSLARMTGRPGLATIASIAVAAVTYFVVMLAVGGIVGADIEMIPKVGPPLARILARLGLVKS
jgi:stage V sporulation protein B